MSCLLFKLQFETPVHFGPPDSALSLYASEETFCADTLFSALCHTALSLHGPEGVETLCRWVQERKLLLSDAMPDVYKRQLGDTTHPRQGTETRGGMGH